jgi:hypothetical protein
MGTHTKAFNAEKWALTKYINWAIKFTNDHPQKQNKYTKHLHR